MPAKILLADKSITIQKVVEMLFAGREYEVVCVSDGETALNEAGRINPDVVLADVDLPRVDGYSFAGQLKKNPALATTPVILMMSRDDVYDNVKGNQAGIVDKIVKPFESQDLIGKVKKAVALAPAQPAKPAPAAVTPPQQTTTPPPPRPAAPAAAKPVEAAPQNIFDIISEAPSRAERKPTAALSEPEAVYEVEPVVEEVEALPVREEAMALPIGAKAVEEMRVGLGLTETKEPPPSQVVDFESFGMAKEAEQIFAPPKEAPSPGIVDFESLGMAKEAAEMAAPPEKKSAPDIVTFESLDMARAAEQMFAPPAQAAPAVQAPSLAPDELKKIAEETISKMAADVFQNMPMPSLPKVSDDTIRRGLQEAVLKVAREMAREVIEQVAWEVIPQLAEHLIKEEIERLKAET